MGWDRIGLIDWLNHCLFASPKIPILEKTQKLPWGRRLSFGSETSTQFTTPRHTALAQIMKAKSIEEHNLTMRSMRSMRSIEHVAPDLTHCSQSEEFAQRPWPRGAGISRAVYYMGPLVHEKCVSPKRVAPLLFIARMLICSLLRLVVD